MLILYNRRVKLQGKNVYFTIIAFLCILPNEALKKNKRTPDTYFAASFLRSCEEEFFPENFKRHDQSIRNSNMSLSS